METGELPRDLLSPEAYPWPVGTVELVTTHLSWVFLAGANVIKVKRPVVYDFVDFARPDHRHRACLDEVRLNRRLTSGVYLDVVAITREGDRYRVAGPGKAVEWATLMRRLPADRMLNTLLARSAAPPDLTDRLARRLVPFHLHGAAPCVGDPGSIARGTAAVLMENLAELRCADATLLAPFQLALVSGAVQSFLDTHLAVLHERAAAGWVREGHGDLRCEHICLEDGVTQIFDCVEFSHRLRCADVASDVAFLLMDLHRLGAPNLVIGTLVQRYRQAGVDVPDNLLRLYWIHRALVRAKVAYLRALDAPGAEQRWADEAADYLNLASAQALVLQPVVIAMTGLSGTGKSTVAAALARAMAITRLSSDEVRKALAQGKVAAGSWQQGIYAPTWTEATYRRLVAAGETAVRRGRPVILDATFLDSERRQEAAAMAHRCGVPFVLIETVCDERIVLRRLAERRARGTSPSDATAETYRMQRAMSAALPPAVPPQTIAITLDTGHPAPSTLDPVLRALDRAGLLAAAIGMSRPLLPPAR